MSLRPVSLPVPVGSRRVRHGSLRQVLFDLVALTKPQIVLLLLLTTLGAMMLAAQGLPPLSTLLLTLLAGAMAAGGASAINQYLDRDIDGVMARTKLRPLPSGRIAGLEALGWGIWLNIMAFAAFAVWVNLLSAALALVGTLFYVFVYTLWLKRSTSQNIVIGGAAGAVPPLVGWAAVTGGLDLPALYLFLTIFVWTPPHFWALALIMRQDYARAGIPMLPVVKGVQETKRQILIYSVALVGVTFLLLTTGTVGPIYLGFAVALNGLLLFYAVKLFAEATLEAARRLFLYSLVYLALLFLAVMVESVTLGG